MKNMKQKWQAFLLLFLLTAAGAFAQTTVMGVVKGADDNQPLAGVVVKLEGTNKGTVTDMNGSFKMDVPSAESKLVFSYVGMQTQTVAAGTSGILNVVMAIGVNMKEVVVTALGVSKETKALGYSVSTVSGDAVRESAEPNVIEALAAKAPGVEVIGSGGTPGASSKILIRGNNTLTGNNQPLIVVDGVPIDNSVNNVSAGDNPYNQNLQGVNESNRALDLDPADIASVTILKGAAAAALYGSSGANGAIIYTTKRGHKGKGLNATVSSGVEIDKVSQLPKLQNRWAQGTWGGTKGDSATYSTVNYAPGSSNMLTGGTGSSWGPLASTVGTGKTYDNVKNFFQTGVLMNNNVSINGGNDNSSVRLSVGNTHQTGIIPNSKLDRTSARLTADTKVNSWFDMGGTVNYSNTATEKPQNGSNLSGIMLSLLRTPISFDARNTQFVNGVQRQYFAAYDNPYYTAFQDPFTDETNRVMGNMFFNIKPVEYFTFTGRFGMDAYQTNNEQVYAVSSLGNDLSDGTGQVNRTSITSRQLYTDLMGKYTKQINENLGVNVLMGYNYQYFENSSVFTRGRGLAIPGFYNFSGASTLYTSNSEAYQHESALFLDASFDWKRALYLSVTGRNEWNTAFGQNSPSFFYPKTDLSWAFSESIKLPKWFSFGKVRASYASVGKAPGVYTNKNYYAVPLIADGWTNGFGFPYNGNPAYALSSTLNAPNLVPERTNEMEFGTDIRFFDSRVTLDATYYTRKTTNVLLFQPVAASTGYSSEYTNAGEIDNHGVELALGLVPVKIKDFSWEIMTNWSRNISEVTKLANGVTQYSIESGFTGIGSYAIVGQPYGVFYGTDWQRNAAGQLLIGANGIPLQTTTSVKIGNPNPDWLMGINNSFKYKAWTFSFLWDIRHGGQIWNGTWQSLNSRGRSIESDARDGSNSTYVIPGVYAPGTPGAGQSNSTAITAFSYFANYLGQNGAASNAIQDGGWVRLRSIGVSYHLNLAKGEKKSFVQYVDLGVSARNLYLYTKYKGVDPETSLTGAGSNINGYDYFNNPGTKSFMFNVKFGL